MKKKLKCREGNLVRLSRKLVLTMKLTFLLIVLGVTQLSATVYSQNTTLSINLNNCTVKDVLEQIEEQTEFRFFYNEKFIDLDRTVSVRQEQKSVEEILDGVFSGMEISYKVMTNNLILITPRADDKAGVMAQVDELKGKVVDMDGAPLPGVTVIVKGTTNGTITDFDGVYTLHDVPNGATLVYSFVGMRSKEIVVEGQAAIDVTLEEETIGIEEVVAIGYGTQKKVNLTGSVSNVTSEVLESRPEIKVLPGSGRVIVVEPLEQRRQKALDMGFEVIDSTTGDAGATLREMTGGIGVDKIIEAAGVPVTVQWSLAALRKGGRIAAVGIPNKGVEIDMRELVLYELEIAGSRASAGEMRRVMPHVADGRMRLSAVMTHEFSLSDYADALSTFRDPESGAIKIIIKP